MRLSLAHARRRPMIGGCQHVLVSADSGTCMPSLASAPARPSLASSAIRRRGSSPSPGGQKNPLRLLWAAAPQLVRSQDPPRPGSLLWRSADLLGRRGPARRLPALRGGEAGALGVPGRPTRFIPSGSPTSWAGGAGPPPFRMSRGRRGSTGRRSRPSRCSTCASSCAGRGRPGRG